jgi:hypothetical protein
MSEKDIQFLTLEALERIMADLTKLTADVTAQTGLIQTLTAHVADLKTQLAAALASVNDQAEVDALDATVESNNAAIMAATS